MGPLNVDFKKIVLLLIFGAVPLIAINTQRNQGANSLFLSPFSAAVGFVHHLYSDFSSGVKQTASFYLNLINIKKQNLVLNRENEELRTRLSQFDEILQENQRLNSLLDFKKNDHLDLAAAKVVGTDLNADYDTIRINRGTKDGLKPYMAVISTEGVVGYIFRPQLHTSQVLLVTDRNSVVDGHIQRSRARGLIEGNSRDKLRMIHLLRADDVIVGDQVVTSGINKIFPKGFPIGKVTSIEKDAYGISQLVEVKPQVNPYNIDEVFVVKKVIKEEEEAPAPAAPPAGKEKEKAKP